MSNNDLGTVIARRVFDCGEMNVMLEIGTPYRMGQGPDCWCPYRISGLGCGEVKRVGGVDSMQALYLAMQAAAADLYSSNAAREKILEWLGSTDLGLPVRDVIADLVPKDEA